MKGRKPLPTVIRMIQGNRSKRPMNRHELKPPEGLPECPRSFDELHKDTWNELVEITSGMGVLTVADSVSLELFADALTMYRKSPSANLRSELIKFCALFGMDPSSRARIKMQPRERKDELAEFVS